MAESKQAAEMAVARPVIGGEADRDERPFLDPAIRHPRALGDPSEADDRDLRRVDDADHRVGPALAEAGHGHRRVGQFGAAQAAGARPADEIAKRRHEIGQRLLVGIVDGRRNEPAAAERNRPADVDAGAGTKAVLRPRSR